MIPEQVADLPSGKIAWERAFSFCVFAEKCSGGLSI
jgi:hypothetical protein